MSFPIDSIIEVLITRATRFPSQQGFGIPLIMDINTVQSPGDIDTFTDINGLIDAGHATASQAVLAATALLSQNPRPTEIKLARREANVAQKENLAVGGTVDGTYTVTLNGIDFTFVASSNTKDQIVDGLLVAIAGGSEPVTPTDNGPDFDLTASVPGVGFSFVVKADPNPSNKMVITVVTPNTGAASEIQRIFDADQDWFFVTMTDRTKSDILELATQMSTIRRLYGFETDEDDSKDLSPGSDTTSILAVLKAAKYDFVFGQWTKSSNLSKYPAAAWIGQQAPKDPGSTTWKFKGVIGPAPDDELSVTEKANILDKNGNVYTTVGGQAMFEEGVVSSGEFIDVIRGVEFLLARMKENVFSLFLTEEKIPFTNGGIAQVLTQVDATLQLGVDQGILTDDPGREPTSSAPDILDIPAADRAVRFLDNVEFEAFLQGAIHKVKISGRISI